MHVYQAVYSKQKLTKEPEVLSYWGFSDWDLSGKEA